MAAEQLKIRPMLAAKMNEKDDPIATAKNRALVERHLAEDGFMLMQPKIDGMRVLCHDDARSRSWKPWTNRYMQAWVADYRGPLWGWDGEMLPGLHTVDNVDPEVFRRAMSEVRSEDGTAQLTYFLFDTFDPARKNQTYQQRLDSIIFDTREFGTNFAGTRPGLEYTVRVILCPTKPVYTLEEIDAAHLEFVAAGWEGSILRRWNKGYKYNRATMNDGLLIKIKDVEDDEAEIIGFEPRYHNANEATISNLGFTQRSAHNANMVAEGRLGAFLVRLVSTPAVEFKIGVLKGFTLEDREKIWANKEKYLGAILKFEHQGYGGGYDKPRTPVGIGFRDKVEL